MGIETLRYAELGLTDPVGIVGFPSVGLVSSIAANYYVTQLGMQPVMGLCGSDLPPYCVIVGGEAYAPIRIYGRKSQTKTGRDVVVCTSEYSAKPEDCYDVATAVLEGLRDLGCREVVCLEGVPRGSDEDAPVIFASGPNGRRMAERSGLAEMQNGMIKGVSGIMMYKCRSMGMSVAAIMCPANPNIPDPGSAISFVEPLSGIVKGLKINTRQLTDEAEEIRRKIESEQASVERDATQSAIYG